MKKRRQHYVWQYYLEAWTQGNHLFCLRDNSIFKTATINIAQIKDFYRLNELTEKDIALVTKLFIEPSLPGLQQLHSDLLQNFTLLFKLKTYYKRNLPKNAEFEKDLDIAINNLEEDLHSNIECTAIPLLDSIRSGDISFYNDSGGKIDFNYFIATQYFRTNYMKKRIAQVSCDPKISKSGINIDRIWNIASHILATNLAYSLSRKDYGMNLFLLENETEIPFITSDQPVINLKTNYCNYEIPTELEFYYPQTPKIALILSNSAPEKLTKDTVIRLNDSIVAASQEQVYANEKNVLSTYIPSIP